MSTYVRIGSLLDYETRLCTVCSAEYKPSRFNQKRCSSACNDKRSRATDAWNRRNGVLNDGHPVTRKGLANHLRRSYNLSLETFDRMVLKSEGRCESCETPTVLFVDHCHTTLVVRGLLCRNCNFAAGQLKDSPDRAIALATYLLTTQPVDLLGALQ